MHENRLSLSLSFRSRRPQITLFLEKGRTWKKSYDHVSFPQLLHNCLPHKQCFPPTFPTSYGRTYSPDNTRRARRLMI